MEITLATKKDIDGILALQPQIYHLTKLPPNAQAILTNLIRVNWCHVLVAKDNSKVVGSAFVFYLPIPAHGAPYAYLEGMVVDSKYRGKGIGMALTQKAIELAKQKKCYKFLLVSGFNRSDIHKFYEKQGFKKWGYEFRMDLPTGPLREARQAAGRESS